MNIKWGYIGMKKILFFIIFFFCVAALVFLSVRKYEERKKDVAFRNEINSYLYNRGEGEGNFPGNEFWESYGYPIHRNIITTVFWVGEKADEDNGHIANSMSAWDSKWEEHFGGVDDPEEREGLLPDAFTPDENPFYFALPYNDFTDEGKRKTEVFSLAGWTDGAEFSDGESLLKNRWIRIEKNGRSAFAQWEDIGPFEEDDADYVFGGDPPKNTEGKRAGLDVSPAVRDYLGIGGVETVDWQFVEEEDVPDGPWKKIITKSQVYRN
ncbi:MAG TPA: hypothetical protein DCX32_04215 [Candidatus Moranbacteria bacterium]|nr:hypothetical protein [Candidatus Moranbacteria bacterium]